MNFLRERVIPFLKKHKKQLASLLLVLLCSVIISAITALLLFAFDIMYIENGDLRFNTVLFESFKYSLGGRLLFILIQTVLTVLLCALPGTSMAFIILAEALYPVPWQAFLMSFIGVMASSMSMYITGRLGGYRLCARLLGNDDCERALGLLREKGTVFFPLMMLFPMFPDDALVMIAGTVKMKLSWFIPSMIFGRGIGIATIIFGMALIESLDSPLQWVLLILLCAALVLLLFASAIRLNGYLEKRSHGQGEPRYNGKEDTDACTPDGKKRRQPDGQEKRHIK